MAQINLKQIEAFVQVADKRSFRGAAAALQTTQPNISARIASLEAQLGQKLMLRDAGSTTLTSTGKMLLNKARDIQTAVDAFKLAVNEPRLFDGVLRLGVTEMIVHSWLGEFLALLNEKLPKVSIDLQVDLSANLSAALANGALDLALQSGPFANTATGHIALGKFPLVWVASPRLSPRFASTLKQKRTELSLDALVEFPLLTHARETEPFIQIEKHLQHTDNVRLVPSTNLAACLHMTIEGLGIACLPYAMVRSELAENKLTQLNYQWSPAPLRFVARYEKDSARYHVKRAASIAKEVSLKHSK